MTQMDTKDIYTTFHQNKQTKPNSSCKYLPLLMRGIWCVVYALVIFPLLIPCIWCIDTLNLDVILVNFSFLMSMKYSFPSLWVNFD